MAQQENKGTRGSQQIRDVMTANPTTVSEKNTIRDAAQIMKKEDTGIVPVVDGRKIIGLVTDRDIVVRLVAEGRNPSEVRVDEVMTKNVRSLTEDSTVDEALSLMSSAEVRRLPVVNAKDELVGIVSIGDISVETNRDGKVGQALEDISGARPNN